jgi:hypothetical protein
VIISGLDLLKYSRNVIKQINKIIYNQRIFYIGKLFIFLIKLIMDISDVIAIILGIIVVGFIIAIIVVFSTVSINCKKCLYSSSISPYINKFYQQIQQKLVGDNNIGPYVFLGAYTSIDISDDGNTIVVGGFGDDSGVGCAYVFVNQNGIYTQFGPKLVGTGYVGMSSQGLAVAISGDSNTIAIGGYTDDNQTGATWIFIRSITEFVQQGPKLVALDAIGSSYQGVSVRK